MGSTGGAYLIEFTFWCNDVLGPDSFETIRDIIGPTIKAGTFQLELGAESGRLHFQGIFSLRKRRTLCALGKSFATTELKGISFRYVSAPSAELFKQGIDVYW